VGERERAEFERERRGARLPGQEWRGGEGPGRELYGAMGSRPVRRGRVGRGWGEGAAQTGRGVRV